MHPLFEKADRLSHEVIGAAIEVHRMKLLNVPIGLLLNYHEPVLKDGIVRLILPGANLP